MQARVFTSNDMEKHPWLIKLLRVFLVPILNIIPAGMLQSLVHKSSGYGSKVIDVAGTSHSLETMYTKEKTVRAKSAWESFANNFWHNIISQPKAIRNRLKIVEKILKKEINQLIASGNEVTIYNLGGGSSRAVIQSLSKLKPKVLGKIHVSTLDKSPKALDLGKQLAKSYKVDKQFNWIEGNIRNVANLLPTNSADLVEMVGLLDYFDHSESVNIISAIYKILKPNGVFLVANVHPNNEAEFVKNVGWPKMHYKTAEELSAILSESGFKEEYLELIFEPLKVHLIGIARKN